MVESLQYLQGHISLLNMHEACLYTPLVEWPLQSLPWLPPGGYGAVFGPTLVHNSTDSCSSIGQQCTVIIERERHII